MNVNDIWAFLHHPDQAWYVRSDMGPGQGYLFDTLGVAHGAATIDGEEELKDLLVALQERSAHVPSTSRPSSTPTLAAAWQELDSLRAESESGPVDAEWHRRLSAVADRLIRRSVEMRLVATLVEP